MPRLPGRREVYEVPGLFARRSFNVYLSEDGGLACHDCVDNAFDHLFVGSGAREACLADLRASIVRDFGVDPVLTVHHVDVVVAFPFPDTPHRRIAAGELPRASRRLGRLGRSLLGLGVVMVVALAIALAWALSMRQAEQVRAAETRRRLESIAKEIPWHFTAIRYAGPPKAPTACFVKLWPWSTTHPFAVVDPKGLDGSRRIVTKTEADLEPFLRDTWGSPIRYRQPGPVHKHGWDLWSCGPDDVDEEGLGDDILIGADMAPVTSQR